MLPLSPTPLVRLGNLFSRLEVFAKCEFLAPSGCFKIRGATHLLEHLTSLGGTRKLIVPSMGNTALGAATAAQAFGFTMTGVVPQMIAGAKEEKLKALGVELVKIAGGGSDLIRHATTLAAERGGYFVHPHLDVRWTDGYRSIASEIQRDLPGRRSLVLPVGGGGLLMGLCAHLREHPSPMRLLGCEPHNYPKYARFNHVRSDTIADGLKLENPHPSVQHAIADAGVSISLVSEDDIRAAMRDLYDSHGLVVEPSSAIALAYVKNHAEELEGPICVILTGENISRDHHRRLIGIA
ncbi:MAG TPA: PLP-dependent lyase/thiolase [Gemmata sp.]|jgi:threonine dehydratase|nr:PLP-dependent lyase/thiolase [Gemmata sp.]